jgi:peptidoglycan hydrolase CwlO-like protein
MTGAELGVITGIVGGVATVIGVISRAIAESRKTEPENRIMVMTAGEKAVQILDHTINTQAAHVVRLEKDLERSQAAVDDLRRIVEERTERLRESQDTVRELATELAHLKGTPR